MSANHPANVKAKPMDDIAEESEPLPLSTPQSDAAAQEHLEQFADMLRYARSHGVLPESSLAQLGTSFDRFARTLVEANPSQTIYCDAGCTSCCHQWVYDVSAVEISAIAQLVQKRKDKHAIVLALKERETAYRRVLRRHACDDDESVEEIAFDYWKLRKRCPLLSEHSGQCSIYENRPFTCRQFLSLKPATMCQPDHVRRGEAGTFLVSASDTMQSDLHTLDEILGDENDSYEPSPFGNGDFFPMLVRAIEQIGSVRVKSV